MRVGEAHGDQVLVVQTKRLPEPARQQVVLDLVLLANTLNDRRNGRVVVLRNA